MSAFAPALNRWASEQNTSVRQVALNAEMSVSDLGKVARDEKGITLDSLARLLPAIVTMSSRVHARALLVAYLQDEVPGGWRNDVHIKAVQDHDLHITDPIAAVAARWVERARSDTKFGQLWLLEDQFMTNPNAADAVAVAASYEASANIVSYDPRFDARSAGLKVAEGSTDLPPPQDPEIVLHGKQPDVK